MRVSSGATTSPPRGEGSLPPLARSGGSGALPKLAQGLLRSGSRDCGSLGHPLPVSEGSNGTLAVSRSPLSGSSKLPFPPDRMYANDFQWTLHSRDLPPEIRPIVEDNKMLQEELRRYKSRVGEQEGLLASRERQLVALRDELGRERQRFKECGGVTHGQLLQDQRFKQQLQEREASIVQLQQKAGILEKAKAAAERRLTNDLATERRAQAELRRQLKQLQEEMAEKQKQSRFNQLHINQLYKRLEPLEAAIAAAAQAPAAAPPLPEPQERVHVMLVHVYEQPQATAAEIAEAAARLAAEEAARVAAELRRRQEPHAVQIQAAWRGFRARRQLAALHAAAARIQAAHRGMQARRVVAPLLHQQRMAELEARGSGAGLPEAALTPAQRLLLRQRAAEQQYKERRAQTGRRSSVAAGRGANTAVEAAARNRSIPSPGGQGASGGHGQASPLSGSSGGGGGGSSSGTRGSISGASGSVGGQGARPGNRGSISGVPGILAGTGARRGNRGSIGSGPGALAGTAPRSGNLDSGSGGKPGIPPGNAGSDSGGGPADGSPMGRSSRPSVAGVPPLDLLQHAQQQRGRASNTGLGGDSSRGMNGSLGGRPPGAQYDGQLEQGQPAKKRPSVSLGFGSSQPLQSGLAGGA